MNQEEIIAFIQKHSTDVSPEAIKDALVSSGVSEEEIEKAWKKIVPPQATNVTAGQTREQVAVVSSTPVADTAWEASLLPNAPVTPPVEQSGGSVAGVAGSVPVPESEPLKAAKAPVRHAAKFPAMAIVLASFLIGGGAFAYWSFVASVLSPTEVLGNMTTALETATSGRYNGTIEFSFEQAKRDRDPGLATSVLTFIEPLLFAQDIVEPLSGEGSIADESIQGTLSVSGGFDQSSPTNKRGSFKGKLVGSMMGQKYDVGVDVRTIGNANYVKFDNISQFAPNYKKLEEEWVKFDSASMGALQAGAESETDEKAAEEKLKNVSAGAKEKISSLFAQAHIFAFSSRGKEAMQAGVTAYHYVLDVDKEGLRQFLEGMLAVVYEEGIEKETFKITPPSQETARESIKSVIDALQEASGELWIGTEDFLPHRSEIQLTLQDASGSVFHLKMQIDFDNWNKPLTVTAPTESVDAVELITTWKNETNTRSRDAQRIADTHHLMLALELYYDDAGHYPQELSELVVGNFLPNNLIDPDDGSEYVYAVSPNGSTYHLGASLSAVDNESLAHDQDFDSQALSWSLGFSGSDTAACRGSAPGSCYDMTP